MSPPTESRPSNAQPLALGSRSSGSLETGAFYDAMWQRYARLDAASPAAFHRRRLIRSLALRYAPDPCLVLDVGCGQGELLCELATHMPSAVLHGADISEQSLADSRRDRRFTLFLMDLTDPTFDQRYGNRLGYFDLVVCSEVIEHIENDALAAARLRSLLKPGGIVIVTVPGGKMSRFDEEIGHRRHYTRERLSALLRGAGLSVENAFAWGFPFHSLYRTTVRMVSRAVIRSSPRDASTAHSHASATAISKLLGWAYALFGAALKPLFYLNQRYWGEQLFAVARKP
jgi:SAM-dependent methyltransferase